MPPLSTWLSYYPNVAAKNGNYAQHAHNREAFEDYCLGSNTWHSDSNGIGWWRDRSKWPLEQLITRFYQWQDFQLWEKWEKSGRNIFDFSAGLLEMLGHTDAGNVEVKRLRLPYPIIYLDLSAADIPFALDAEARVQGVYVTEETDVYFDDCLTAERCIGFHFCGDYLPNFKYVNELLDELGGRGFADYSLFSDGGEPAKSLTIQEAVSDAVHAFSYCLLDDYPEERKTAARTLHRDFINRTSSLVANCLLYLLVPDKDVQLQQPQDIPQHLRNGLNAQTKRRRAEALAELTKRGYSQVNYVGQSFQRRTNGIGLNEPVASHWRRGHWREQRVGAGLVDKKIIWIQPLIVHKEAGPPATGRVYSVESGHETR